MKQICPACGVEIDYPGIDHDDSVEGWWCSVECYVQDNAEESGLLMAAGEVGNGCYSNLRREGDEGPVDN